MNGKETKRVWMTVLCLVLNALSCYTSACNITTFVERGNVIGTSNATSQHFTLLNTTFGIQYQVIEEEKGLSGIMRILPKGEPSSTCKAAFATSYVGTDIGRILQELYFNKKDLSPLTVDQCSEVSSRPFRQGNLCGKYKAVYVSAMKALMADAFSWPLTMIVDANDECASAFADRLLRAMVGSSMFNSPEWRRKIYIHKVTGDSTMIQKVWEALYKAITTSTATIILLCSDRLAELVFARSRLSPSLKSNVIWVTLESHVEDRFVPSILLKLEMIGNGDSVPVLGWNSLNHLNIKKAMVVGASRKQLPESVANHMVQNAINSSQIICHAKTHTKQTVMVLLRQPNSNWLPMYSWTSDNQITLLSFDPKISWLSRFKFHKSLLRVVTVYEEPFAMFARRYLENESQSCSEGVLCRVPHSLDNVSTWRRTCCIGFSMDLLKRLQSDLWLSIDLYIVEDGLYGGFVGGKWNGMVGELVRDNADMIMAPITATSKRSPYIDFGESIADIVFAIILRSDRKTNMPFFNFSFVENVTSSLLWVLVAMFFFGFFFIFLLENTLFCPKNEVLGRYYRFKEGFSYVSGITFQRDLGGKNPKASSARISFVVFAFGMVIVMSTYTATLTAVKVQQEDHDVFKGINDPKLSSPTRQFKFATVRSSNLEEYFQFSSDPQYHNMHLFMKQYNTKTTENGVKQVISGELQAFILEHPMAEYYASTQKSCNLQVIRTKNGKSSWNVAFQRGSRWNSIVSKKVLEYKDKTLISDVYKKWMHSKCTAEDGNSAAHNEFDIQHFGGLIAILSFSFIASFVLLLLEHAIFNRRKKHSDNFSLEEP